MSENKRTIEQISSLSRNEIYSKLLEWFGNGVFITTGSKPASDIERKSNKRVLSYTPIPKILFNGDSKDSVEFFEFKTLVDTKRILSPLGMKVEKDLRTLYRLHKAVADKDIMRFEYKDVIIYID